MTNSLFIDVKKLKNEIIDNNYKIDNSKITKQLNQNINPKINGFSLLSVYKNTYDTLEKLAKQTGSKIFDYNSLSDLEQLCFDITTNDIQMYDHMETVDSNIKIINHDLFLKVKSPIQKEFTKLVKKLNYVIKTYYDIYQFTNKKIHNMQCNTMEINPKHCNIAFKSYVSTNLFENEIIKILDADDYELDILYHKTLI